MARPEPQINPAAANLLLAKEEYPDLDVNVYLERFERLSEQAEQQGVRVEDDAESVRRLCRYLFDDLGFRGNNESYYDPKNSFLNEVLDRKLGIPITLSIVFVEVGLRLGLPLVGVSFPGHFLAKCVTPRGDVIVDSFRGGRILTTQDCRELLTQMFGGKMAFAPEMLAPAKPKEIISRIINNLKAIYLKQQDWGKAMRSIEQLRAVDPSNPEIHRDRAAVLGAQGAIPQALKELETYAAQAPNAPDAGEILQQIQALKRMLAGLN